MILEPSATPRKRPKQDRSQATVEAILIAAAHILTENGYNKFTTNRVAELAGVSIGSLYQYFPNKESLIFALGEHHANEMAQIAQQHLGNLEESSIIDVLRQIIKAVLAAHPDLRDSLRQVEPFLHSRRETMWLLAPCATQFR